MGKQKAGAEMSDDAPGGAGDPFADFKDLLGKSLRLGAPMWSKELADFGRALHAGLDNGAASFEKSRDFVRAANDRIVNKSIGILQFNAVILAVIVLFVDSFSAVNRIALLVCTICVILSALMLLMNMHLYTMRDAGVYADARRHYFQQLTLFQRRARYHSLGLWLSVAGLVALTVAFAGVSLADPPIAPPIEQASPDTPSEVSAASPAPKLRPTEITAPPPAEALAPRATPIAPQSDADDTAPAQTP